jgi:hypothetical protein
LQGSDRRFDARVVLFRRQKVFVGGGQLFSDCLAPGLGRHSCVTSSDNCVWFRGE